MNGTIPPAPERLEARILSQVERGLYKAIAGRLQRINYRKKELAVVADGQVRYFQVDQDSQLWFDDQRTILRCFHPLDQVKVIFQEGQPNSVKALYAWENQLA